MNKILTLGAAFSIVAGSVGPLALYAQSTTPGGVPPKPSVRQELRKDIRDTRVDTRQDVRDIRVDTRKDIRDVRTETRDSVRDTRIDARQDIKNTRQDFRAETKGMRAEFASSTDRNREEFKAKMGARRAELKNSVEAKRTELRAKLGKIKDERKKEIVEKIDAELDALNARMAEHFSAVLVKLEEALARIAERADRVGGAGRDVSAVRVAISAAESAIASAREVIAMQGGKTYAFNITSETNLRTDVGKARQALRNDLAKVHGAVKAAHESVRKVAVALADVRNTENTTPPVTATGSEPAATSSR